MPPKASSTNAQRYEALWASLFKENKAVLKNFQQTGTDISKPMRLSFRAQFTEKENAIATRKALMDNYELASNERIQLRTKHKKLVEYLVCFDTKIIPTAQVITEYEFALRVYSEPNDPFNQFWVFLNRNMVASTLS